VGWHRYPSKSWPPTRGVIRNWLDNWSAVRRSGKQFCSELKPVKVIGIVKSLGDKSMLKPTSIESLGFKQLR